ncbi:hypothetical protein BDV23DRAFT_186072 [Aspergillus alliaceus]|uniref:Uncharacterized protein n=1 Tax=Petromyces alliaceus TaxID=209559 RepID=A0A5N7C1C3_PETAA|nr:hypothetical protein BDV23DRAFT_186072 [Aspergillus alliaceus]
MQSVYVLAMLLRKVRTSLCSGDLQACHHPLSQPELGSEVQDAAECLVAELQHGIESLSASMKADVAFEGVGGMIKSHVKHPQTQKSSPLGPNPNNHQCTDERRRNQQPGSRRHSAGGLGQIGFLDSKRALAQQFEQARHQLHDLMSSRKDTPKPVLPVGVGMIVFGSPAVHWLSLFSEYRPAVAWLSFRTTDEFRAWAEGIRKASQYTQAWIQVGSVSAALEATQACYPDALVLQGSDAGGHGHAYGASVVSLIVAGGIMDGRGVAAATMLGAAGVVMGTRFLAAEETDLPSEFRKAVFKATDGGQSTLLDRGSLMRCGVLVPGRKCMVDGVSGILATSISREG